jgi:hypothetical protein
MNSDPLAPLWAAIDQYGVTKVAGIIRCMGGPPGPGPAAGAVRGTIDPIQHALLDTLTKLVEQEPPSPEVAAAEAWAASRRRGRS